MPDPTPLTEAERQIVWWCAGCDECRPQDDSERSKGPCDGPSHDGVEVVRASDYERLRAFYSERERALREALEEIASRIEGKHARGDMTPAEKSLWQVARAALGPTDPAPSTTEGERDGYCWRPEICKADGHCRSVLDGRKPCHNAPVEPRPTTEGVGGDDTPSTTGEATE